MGSNELESSTKLAVLIMATGSGTPLKSRRLRVLHEVGGKPLLSYVIAAAAQVAGPSDIYVVVGHKAEQVKAAVSATGVRFIDQENQPGPGHPLSGALEAIAGYAQILLLPGDVPLIRPETIERLWPFHLEQAAMTHADSHTRRPQRPMAANTAKDPAPRAV